MSVDKKVPEIRFKGFSGAWDNQPFRQCFNNIPSNTLSRADLNYQTGLAQNIHYGDVLIKFGEVLDIGTGSLPFITCDETANKLKHAALKNGDIIIADAAEDNTVGKCTELSNVDDRVVLSGLHTIAVRPTLPFASKFLGYYLNSSSYHDQLLSLMQGTKVLSISKTVIQNTNVTFPSSEPEQTQIGNTFQKLDSLINQHQQKHDKLSSIKKAMLEKMFPKQGETTPEIRFKGFSGEWEEIQFKEIAEIRRGLTYKPSDIVENGVVVLRSSNINIDKFGLRKDDVQVDESAVNINSIKNGNILITSANGSSQLVGKHAVVKGLTIDAVHGGFMLVAETNAPYFLNASMNTCWYNQFLSMNVAGGNGAIGNIKGSALEEECLYIPKKEEQEKIGSYFQKLDTLINQHQQQITKLNNIKQACLSKMFV